MAFVSQASPDQDPTQQPGQNPLSQQAPVTSAPNAGGTGGKAATGQPSNSSQAQPFTNLNSYLTANAPQISNEANQIAGNLTSGYNAATGAIDQASQSFGKDVNNGYTQSDPNVLAAVQSNPTSVAADPTQSKTFTGMYNDNYTGPATFQDSSYYAPLSSQVQQGQATAAQVGTVPGLQSYLSKDNPSYTQGQSTLDSVLLNGNPDAVKTIQNAATPYANLPAYLTSAVTQGNTAAQTAQQNAQAAKAAAQNAMTTSQGTVNSRIAAEEAAALKQAQDYNAAVQAAQARVGKDVPLANQLKQIMQQYGASWMGSQPTWLDPAKITVPNQVIGLPTAGTVANGQDYSDVAALEQLAGSPFAAAIDPSQASQAGTFKAPGAVDSSQLDSALQALQQFITGPDGNNINVANGGNLSPFVNAANDWYNQLISDMGYKYPGTGPRPAPFTTGSTGFIPGGV